MMWRRIVIFALAAISLICSPFASASDSGDAAVARCQSVIDKNPDSVYAWTQLGKVCLQQDRLDEACRAFRQAAKLNPRDGALQTDLGFCYFEQQKYSTAIPHLERAEKLNPGNSNIHAYLARCYEKVGRHEDAEQERHTENLQQMDMFR